MRTVLFWCFIVGMALAIPTIVPFVACFMLGRFAFQRQTR